MEDKKQYVSGDQQTYGIDGLTYQQAQYYMSDIVKNGGNCTDFDGIFYDAEFTSQDDYGLLSLKSGFKDIEWVVLSFIMRLDQSYRGGLLMRFILMDSPLDKLWHEYFLFAFNSDIGLMNKEMFRDFLIRFGYAYNGHKCSFLDLTYENMNKEQKAVANKILSQKVKIYHHNVEIV